MLGLELIYNRRETEIAKLSLKVGKGNERARRAERRACIKAQGH